MDESCHEAENQAWEEAFAKAEGETTAVSDTTSTEPAPAVEDTKPETTDNPTPEVGKQDEKATDQGEGTKPTENVPKNKVDIHQRNNANAQRRIRAREREKSLRLQANKIQRLKDEALELRNKGELDAEDRRTLGALERDRADLEDVYRQNLEDSRYDEVEDFNREVANDLDGFYPAHQGASLIQKYARYVNEREPLLVELTRAKYGKHALVEWCARCEKDPTMLQKWQRMNSMDKAVTLNGMLKQITALHNGTYKKAGQTVQPPKEKPPVNVAMASTGRGSNVTSSHAEDSFGSLIEAELQRMGRNSI